MSDDGSGQSIGIPSFMVATRVGFVLRDFCLKEEPVIIKIKTTNDLIDKEEQRADVILWFTDALEVKPN